MNTEIRERFIGEIFSTETDFDTLADELWRYQIEQNEVLKAFCDSLGREELTFLPVSFFKYRRIKTGSWNPVSVFESSGTSQQIRAKHELRDHNLYAQSAINGFFHFFPKQKYRILALLPSYLERNNASLVYMVRCWMEAFGTDDSEWYLYDFQGLSKAIEDAQSLGEPILLIGVAFALLDFAKQYPQKLVEDSVVIETGGMKGRKEELTRNELHDRLKAGLGVQKIHSEYGMTELLSQAYTVENGRFRTPPWMKVMISDIHLSTLTKAVGRSGRINIIDLANLDSCAFLSTDDVGRMHEDGSFEVLGRLDFSEMRGCNLMYI